MIGLDTNVLVRLAVGDDPGQAAAAAAFLERSCSADDPAYVTTIVLCELAWVLGHTYGYGRESLHGVLDRLRAATDIRFEYADVVDEAITTFAAGGPGFADHLVAGLHRRHGVTRTVTFDRKASKMADWELLPTA